MAVISLAPTKKSTLSSCNLVAGPEGYDDDDKIHDNTATVTTTCDYSCLNAKFALTSSGKVFFHKDGDCPSPWPAQ